MPARLPLIHLSGSAASRASHHRWRSVGERATRKSADGRPFLRYAGWLVAACLMWLLLGSRAYAEAEAEAEPEPVAGSQRAAVIHFEGPIDPLLKQFVFRSLDRARQRQVDVVIIQINSPGGYLWESLDLANRFRDLQWAKTVAYVPDEALSGAAIAALGCDEIVMHPMARLGDAGPVFQGKDALFRHAPEKVRSDLARRVRDLAEANGRPPALAEAMVDDSLVVYHYEHQETGEKALMSEQEVAAREDSGQWKKGRIVLDTREDHFLEVNGKQAVEVGLAEAVVESLDEVKALYNVDELLVIRPNAVDTAVFILNQPLVTGLLFVVGLIALYLEFSAPGISIGGLVAGLCFVLFFWSRFLGGTADMLEVLLFLSGVAFIGVEIFLIPGFGVAGISGLLLMLSSLVLASQSFVVPESGRQLDALGMGMFVVTAASFVFLVAAISLSHYFRSLPVLSRLILSPPSFDEPEQYDEKGQPIPRKERGPPGGVPVAVGDWGVAESALRPAGKAIFGDEYLDVITDGSYVNEGSQVKVINISGNRIMVREVEPPKSA